MLQLGLRHLQLGGHWVSRCSRQMRRTSTGSRDEVPFVSRRTGLERQVGDGLEDLDQALRPSLQGQQSEERSVVGRARRGRASAGLQAALFDGSEPLLLEVGDLQLLNPLQQRNSLAKHQRAVRQSREHRACLDEVLRQAALDQLFRETEAVVSKIRIQGYRGTGGVEAGGIKPLIVVGIVAFVVLQGGENETAHGSLHGNGLDEVPGDQIEVLAIVKVMMKDVY